MKTRTQVCSLLFSERWFTNLAHKQLGFATKLIIKLRGSAIDGVIGPYSLDQEEVGESCPMQ